MELTINPSNLNRFPKAKGGKELRRYMAGGKLSLKQMILAKCYECMGNYVDGKVDCALDDCPLYPMMPYGVAWKARAKGKIPPQFIKQTHQKQKRVRTETSLEATGA